MDSLLKAASEQNRLAFPSRYQRASEIGAVELQLTAFCGALPNMWANGLELRPKSGRAHISTPCSLSGSPSSSAKIVDRTLCKPRPATGAKSFVSAVAARSFRAQTRLLC